MLRNNKRLSLRGFALPELIIGLVIAGIGIAATVLAYVTISQMWQDDLVMNELSRNANIGIERMLHGDSPNTGLLAAKDIISPITGATDDSVVYTDSFNALRSFSYSGGKICTGDGDEIISNVDGVAFYNNGQTLLISLALQKASGSKEINLVVQTQVNPRN